jgi:WD40 repeat protein/tRNA A-37 threonylcarbamoyl transferase component Bud32
MLQFAPLDSNSTIGGRYRVQRMVGKGGFGAVYEGLDTRINKQVAIKQLIAIDDELTEQFELEAKLLAGLRHPNLPDVSDHFADSTGHYLVMEYIAGDDLGAMLESRREPFPVIQVLTWADQLLHLLTYLHTHVPPVIHRDIKPSNIKLAPDGTVKLLDFGLAKLEAGGAGSGRSVRGYTASYASPEQISGSGTDARSDLYSLAVTLHSLLTGMLLPPDPTSRMEAQVRALPDPLPAITALNPRVPQHISTAIAQACMLDPQLRFGSARAMSNALRHAAAQTKLYYPSASAQRISTPAPSASPTGAGPAQLPPASRSEPAPASDRTVRIQPAPSGDRTVRVQPAPKAPAQTVMEPARARPAAKSKPKQKPRRNRGALWRRVPLVLLALVVLIGGGVFAVNSLRPCGGLDLFLERSRCSLSFSAGRELQSLALAPDGETVATGVGKAVILWNASNGELVRKLGEHEGLFANKVLSVAFAPNGEEVVSGGQDDLVRIWRASDAVALHTLAGHRADVRSLAYAPDGSLLASASDDGTIKLWQPASGEVVSTLDEHSGPVTSLAFSADGKLIASGSDDATVKIWDVREQRVLQTLQAQPVRSIAFAPDGRTVAAGATDGRVRLWSLANGVVLQTFEQAHSAIQSVAFTPNGATLVWSSAEGKVFLWDAEADELVESLALNNVLSLAVASDDERIVAGSQNGQVSVLRSTP